MNSKLNALSEGLVYTNRIDLKSFNDDLATDIEWKPLNKLGSSNFLSKKLISISGSHAAIETTRHVKAFISIWFVCWIGAWFWLGVSFAPLAILLGAALFYPLIQIQQFNKTRGFEYGWPWKNKLALVARRDMYALQIIHGGARIKYQTFELNLVANSGTRHAIFKEANLAYLEGIAGELSGIFGIPIWNAARQQIRFG